MANDAGRPLQPSRLDKTLYLHIGFGKTGTSSLQSFFARNQERLSGLGVYYPSTGRDGLDAHHYIATAARPGGGTGYDTDRSWEDYVALLREEIAGRPEPNVLISSEVFSGRLSWRLLRMLKGVFREIRVIGYVRRQDVLIASNYNQWVKSENLTKKLNELVVLPFHFDVWMGVWEKFLGGFPGQLIVRPFEREQLVNGNVIDDFMSAIFGIEVDGTFAPPDGLRANQRLSLDALEFKRVVNCLCPGNISSAFIEPLMQYSQRALVAAPEDEGAILAPQERRALLDAFAAGNALVARRYLNRPDGMLFKTPPPDPEARWKAPTLTFSGALDIARFVLASRAHRGHPNPPPLISRLSTARKLRRIVGTCPAPSAAPLEDRIRALVRGVAVDLHGPFPERTEDDSIGRRWAKP